LWGRHFYDDLIYLWGEKKADHSLFPDGWRKKKKTYVDVKTKEQGHASQPEPQNIGSPVVEWGKGPNNKSKRDYGRGKSKEEGWEACHVKLPFQSADRQIKEEAESGINRRRGFVKIYKSSRPKT